MQRAFSSRPFRCRSFGGLRRLRNHGLLGFGHGCRRCIFGRLALTLLFLGRFGALPGDQLCLFARFFLPQCCLFRIDRGRSGGFGNGRGGLRSRGITLDQNTFLLNFDLDRSRLAGTVGFLDFRRLAPGQSDFVLGILGPMNAPQVVQKLGLVLLRKHGVFGERLAYSRCLQLLEEQRRG